MAPGIDVDEVLGHIFPEKDLRVTDIIDAYPESLLQQTDKANKLYTAFQRHTKQFVPEGDPTSVLRWTHSTIHHVDQHIVDNWSASAPSVSEHAVNRSQSVKHASTLFTWSTGSHERRGHRRTTSTPTELKVAAKPERYHAPVPYIKPTGRAVTNKLNQIIEKEANGFIRDRIQRIKAHHRDQISEQINERKRQDHELHLRRLKEKEEEYDRQFNAAMHDKPLGFFGLFFKSDTAEPRKAELKNLEQKTEVKKELDAKSKRFSFLPTWLSKENQPSIPEADKEDMEDQPDVPEEQANSNEPEPALVVKDPMPKENPTEPEEAEPEPASEPPIVGLDEFEEFQAAPPSEVNLDHHFLPLAQKGPLLELDGAEVPPAITKRHTSDSDLIKF